MPATALQPMPASASEPVQALDLPLCSSPVVLADMSGSPASSIWTATGHERPVFLDEHGRRRPWVALGGTLTAVAASLWLGGLLAGVVGFSSLPSWRTLPAAGPVPGTPYLAGARVRRASRTSPVDRDRRVILKSRTGTPPSPGSHAVLLATARLD